MRTSLMPRVYVLLGLIMPSVRSLHMGGYKKNSRKHISPTENNPTFVNMEGKYVLDKIDVEFGGGDDEMPYKSLLEQGFASKLYGTPAGREHFVLTAYLSRLLGGESAIELGLGPFELGLSA